MTQYTDHDILSIVGEKRMKMIELEEIFEDAKENYYYVAVVIEMEGFPQPELIINTEDNFESKLEYYKKTYDENCNHKFAKGISIVGAECSDYMEDLEALLDDHTN